MRTPSRLLVNILFTIVAILLWNQFTAAQDVADIIRKSTEANNRDWAAAPNFDNSERDRTKDGDKTYAVTMLDGSPYQRLIAANGQISVLPNSRKNGRNTRMH